jgi:hypothetical protein
MKFPQMLQVEEYVILIDISSINMTSDYLDWIKALNSYFFWLIIVVFTHNIKYQVSLDSTAHTLV